jgi:hypothetical protein
MTQRRRTTTLLATGGAVAAVLLLSGCSGVNTDSGMVGLHYKGGPISSTHFANCVTSNTRNYDGPGDKHYQYPSNQRTFDATGGQDADSPPITVVSKDNAILTVPITVNFTLKTDCSTLRRFHERVGLRYAAYFDNVNSPSDGWSQMLRIMIGKPLDTQSDRIAQQYNWRDLWNNPKVKTQLETQVAKDLPRLIKRQAGGNFFDNITVLMQKPTPTDGNLTSAVAKEQAAVATANSEKAQAEAQVAAANAQVAVAQAQAKSKAAEIQAYGGVDGYLKAQAIAKGLNIFQPSYGSAIVGNQR